jgi:hypothetical protein
MRLFRQEEFVARWPEIRPLVDPATPYNPGEYETDDLLTLVKQGRAFALGFLRHDRYEFVMILQTVYMPRKKILFILCWGGKGMLPNLNNLYSTLETSL